MVEKAWVSEGKKGINLNLLLSHYVNLEKSNNPYLTGFYNGEHINVRKRYSTVLHTLF